LSCRKDCFQYVGVKAEHFAAVPTGALYKIKVRFLWMREI